MNWWAFEICIAMQQMFWSIKLSYWMQNRSFTRLSTPVFRRVAKMKRMIECGTKSYWPLAIIMLRAEGASEVLSSMGVNYKNVSCMLNNLKGSQLFTFTLLSNRRSIDLSGAQEKEGHYHYKTFLRGSKWGITYHTCSIFTKYLYWGLGLSLIHSKGILGWWSRYGMWYLISKLSKSFYNESDLIFLVHHWGRLTSDLRVVYYCIGTVQKNKLPGYSSLKPMAPYTCRFRLNFSISQFNVRPISAQN